MNTYKKCIGLFFIFCFGCNSVKQYKNIRKDLRIQTIVSVTAGNVLGFGKGRRGYNVGHYFVNGKIYVIKCPNSNVVGSKFIINYDSLKPWHYDALYFAHPIFFSDENTDITVASVTDLFIADGKRGYVDNISYQYEILSKEGSKKKRYFFNIVLDSGISSYKGLTKGSKYLLQYWTENPQRAIIHLDKPVRDTGSVSN